MTGWATESCTAGQNIWYESFFSRTVWDRFRDQAMARLTRHAQSAPRSPWSRICRWQAGMVTGPSLWFWILLAIACVQATNCGVAKEPDPAGTMMAMTSLVLTFVPAIIAAANVTQWRKLKLRHESLLPVQRESYVRQLGAGTALSHFQAWAGMAIAVLCWWLLIGPRPLRLAPLGGVLASSAEFQVAIFAVLVWTARYRSLIPATFLLVALLPAVLIMQVLWASDSSLRSPGQLPLEALWIAGILAVLGMLATFDAYRRWLVADFD
jgi:hypothetical protein